MQDVAESSGNTVYSYHLGPSACAFLFANCIRLLRYSSKCRKRKVIHRCKVNCVQQQLSKYSWNCTIQLQSSFGPYKTYRSELLVKKKNDNEKIISTKIMQEKSHCSLVVSNWIGSPVEVSQYSNWNALLLDLIPNKTKKKKPQKNQESNPYLSCDILQSFWPQLIQQRGIHILSVLSTWLQHMRVRWTPPWGECHNCKPN